MNHFPEQDNGGGKKKNPKQKTEPCPRSHVLDPGGDFARKARKFGLLPIRRTFRPSKKGSSGHNLAPNKTQKTTKSIKGEGRKKI